MFEVEAFEVSCILKNIYFRDWGLVIGTDPFSRFLILFILVGDTLWNHRINNLEATYDTPGMY